MRRVVTGVGADGRSRVVSDGPPLASFHAPAGVALLAEAPPSPVPAGEAVVHELWALDADASMHVDDPTAGITEAVFDVPAGASKWILTEMGPGLEVPMHATPTVDYGMVVAGEVELGLDDGSVRLRAGDAVVVNGVQHSWHAGPEGCVIATVQVGLRDAER